MRKLTTFTTTAAILLSAASASAEQLDGPGTDLVVGFERMFGFHYFNTDTPPDEDYISFGLLWQRERANPYQVPRITFDATIHDSLTLGGAFGFYFVGADASDAGVFINPRVGWIFDLAQDWALWPRGGLSFYYEDTGAEYTEFGLGIDALFVWMPFRNFGVTGGPGFDVGLAGSGPADGNLNQFSIGLDFGALIHW